MKRFYIIIPVLILSYLSYLLLINYRVEIRNLIVKGYNHFILYNPIPIDSLQVNANSFVFKIKIYKGISKTNKTAGILIEGNKILVFEQNNIEYLVKKYNLKRFLRDRFNSKINDYEPIKQVFNYKGDIICLLVFNDEKNKFISILNVTRKIEVFRSINLPNSSTIDFNGIGGGVTIYGDGVLLAIGVPSSGYNDNISNLARQKSSPFGKVLFFNSIDFFKQRKNIYDFKIFTSGHRNPQGLLNLSQTIYEVEHGPNGGDELNILSEGKDFGWPTYSFGILMRDLNIKFQ